ncbi:hypothetical protein PoB_007465400 [Plakobranchus ocellatus]|uniref:Uncharacterized protein n=1 Tax=Plakobranchus ocellatus TaxID=259542 RepID=A0AAV4DVT8_9GAST|nr:hypothetical protein PoB_007465400 [Plakobranchus ocellatus]
MKHTKPKVPPTKMSQVYDFEGVITDKEAAEQFVFALTASERQHLYSELAKYQSVESTMLGRCGDTVIVAIAAAAKVLQNPCDSDITDSDNSISKTIGSEILNSPVFSPQQGDLRLSSLLSGQGAGSGARTRDKRVPADLRADSQATVLPTPPFSVENQQIYEREM